MKFNGWRPQRPISARSATVATHPCAPLSQKALPSGPQKRSTVPVSHATKTTGSAIVCATMVSRMCASACGATVKEAI